MVVSDLRWYAMMKAKSGFAARSLGIAGMPMRFSPSRKSPRSTRLLRFAVRRGSLCGRMRCAPTTGAPARASKLPWSRAGRGSEQLGLDRVLHDEVDAASEDVLQPALNPEELEEAHWLAELDQEVRVAVGMRVAARKRAKEMERAHSQSLELG